MPRSLNPYHKHSPSISFYDLYQPIWDILPNAPILESRGDRPLKMSFEDQLKALIFFHLEEHTSGRHLIQALNEDDFARNHIAPKEGIKKSSFFEAINHRGLEQLEYILQELCNKATYLLPKKYTEFGSLVAIDGSLINAVLSMHWADYRKESKKAKVHLGFDLNQGIPVKIFITNGKGAERPFVDQILSTGQTGVCDRGYQEHLLFDKLQAQGKSFVIRIKAKTIMTCITSNEVKPDGMVFYDAEVMLGSDENNNKTQTPVRVIGYRVSGVDYWVATDRKDITAEQIAQIYKMRWNIEKFFAWWKRHLRVYHLIARSEYGLSVQILAGLITYLLLAIYCYEKYNEPVSINRVRELRHKIQNEIRKSNGANDEAKIFKEQIIHQQNAKT
jgi:hypothetical protein